MFNFNATFIIAMLSFVVFIMIMNAIFYTPILNIIRKREEYLENNYSESKKYDKQADEFKQTHSQKIKETQDECRNVLKQKLSKFQAQTAIEINNKRENSKTLLKERKEELLKQELQMREKINNTVINDLSNIVIEKIFNGVTK